MSPTKLPYEIIPLDSFEDELTAITDYLTENASYKVSLQLIDDIETQLSLITTLPYIYPVYAPAPRFRKMPVNNWRYVIFYTVDENKHQIALTHIYHTSRDIHSIMQEE